MRTSWPSFSKTIKARWHTLTPTRCGQHITHAHNHFTRSISSHGQLFRPFGPHQHGVANIPGGLVLACVILLLLLFFFFCPHPTWGCFLFYLFNASLWCRIHFLLIVRILPFKWTLEDITVIVPDFLKVRFNSRPFAVSNAIEFDLCSTNVLQLVQTSTLIVPHLFHVGPAVFWSEIIVGMSSKHVRTL